VVRASTSVGNDTPADLGAPPLMSPLGQLDTERRPVAAPPPVLQGDIARDQASIEALLDDGKFTDALAAYKVMAKINSQDRVARAGIELCEGLRALANKDRLEAAQRFESVLEIDPSNERAARELAEMRRMATNERKGLLTKLMNKKD
jgi:predicted nucleic acid-binding protein